MIAAFLHIVDCTIGWPRYQTKNARDHEQKNGATGNDYSSLSKATAALQSTPTRLAEEVQDLRRREWYTRCDPPASNNDLNASPDSPNAAHQVARGCEPFSMDQ